MNDEFWIMTYATGYLFCSDWKFGLKHLLTISLSPEIEEYIKNLSCSKFL
jgi:hypothetical protein